MTRLTITEKLDSLVREELPITHKIRYNRDTEEASELFGLYCNMFVVVIVMASFTLLFQYSLQEAIAQEIQQEVQIE